MTAFCLKTLQFLSLVEAISNCTNWTNCIKQQKLAQPISSTVDSYNRRQLILQNLAALGWPFVIRLSTIFVGLYTPLLIVNKCNNYFKMSMHARFKHWSMFSKGVGCMIGVHCTLLILQKFSIKRTENMNIKLMIKVHNRMPFITGEFVVCSKNAHSNHAGLTEK